MAHAKSDIPLIIANPQWIDGIPYLGFITKETIRKLSNTTVDEEDVFITGYPKSGNHWLLTTVEAILKHDELHNFINNGPKIKVECLENPVGYQKYLECKKPRTIFTHLRYNQLPKDLQAGKGKMIHVSRNPRDVAVSYFHFVRMDTNFGPFTGSWDTFFDSFIAGRVSWGSWYDYMDDWMQHRDEPNILFVRYEDFIENSNTIIKSIADFIGKTLNEETINRIAEIVSFKSMKNNPNLNIKHECFKGEFLRKGIIGDWINYFTPEQQLRMDEMYQKLRVKQEYDLGIINQSV